MTREVGRCSKCNRTRVRVDSGATCAQGCEGIHPPDDGTRATMQPTLQGLTPDGALPFGR